VLTLRTPVPETRKVGEPLPHRRWREVDDDLGSTRAPVTMLSSMKSSASRPGRWPARGYDGREQPIWTSSMTNCIEMNSVAGARAYIAIIVGDRCRRRSQCGLAHIDVGKLR
jgi:hypothetical protein